MNTKNAQRKRIKHALIKGLLFEKNMAILKAQKEDMHLPFPVHQLGVEAQYQMMINNVIRTNSKVFRMDGLIDKRRNRRFGLKGKSYIVKPNV